MTETREARIKRLLWRSQNRGIREMDILLGGFALGRLPSMNDAELVEFEAMVDTPDQDLLSWVLGERPMPASRNCGLMCELLQFKP
jgi:antitoxin CptB